MKRKIQLLSAMLMLICTSAFAQTSLVTFQVSSPDSTPVYVFGSWNWNGWPGTPMTMVAPGKYTATLALAQNTTHEYLFVNGNAPHAKEVLNPAWTCTNGNTQYTNRVLALGSTDTGVCYTFATCNTCTVTPPPPPPTPINVTFQVESPDSLPVAVQGSWNWGNFPGAAMTQVAPNKYSVTLQFQPNTSHEFLFINGNGATAQKEILSPSLSCTNGNATYTNRTLNLGNTDTSICFTWKTCNTCTIAPPPVDANVTFQVESPDSIPVYVRGSWNNWASNTLMTMVAPNKYAATIQMPKSASYEFKYQNGAGQTYETLDPTWPCTNANTQYTNRVLNLGTTDTTLCNMWSSCNTCTVPQTNVLYTFQVSNPDSTPVYLFGSWNWNAFPGTLMTSIGGNIYEATMNLPINDTTIEYLYVNGTVTKEVLNPAWTCTNGNGQFTNRKIINTGTTPKTLCNKWASCDTCGQVTPTNINVKFAVQSPDSTPVYVFGNWNNWSNFPGTPMVFNSSLNRYEATIPMLASKTIEYFYTNGTGTKEPINPADPCTNGNGQFTNRVANLGTTDTAFCNIWKTCTACGPSSISNLNPNQVNVKAQKGAILIGASTAQVDEVCIFDIYGRKIYGASNVKTNTSINVNTEFNTIYIITVKDGNNYIKVKSFSSN